MTFESTRNWARLGNGCQHKPAIRVNRGSIPLEGAIRGVGAQTAHKRRRTGANGPGTAPRAQPKPPATGANTPYRLTIKLGYHGMSCNNPTKNHTHEEANHPGPCRRHCVPNRVRIRRHPQHDHDVATDFGARSHDDDHDGYPKQVGFGLGLSRMRQGSSSCPPRAWALLSAITWPLAGAFEPCYRV
jgi:hypothetical protein